MSTTAPVIEQRQKDVLLRVRVQPKASRESIELREDGRLRVSVMAPPVDGAANKAVEKLLSARLVIPRRRISFESGEQSREKTLRIADADVHDIAQRLGLTVG